MGENERLSKIGESTYARRGDEKPAPVEVKPYAEVPKVGATPIETVVPKVELSPPKDKVLNIHNSDVEHYKQCEAQLKALQKAWAAARTARLPWDEVCNQLRPIIEKPTAEF